MKLVGKDYCTGCGNCIFACKKQAIEFKRDELNNIYPQIDESKCVECGLCNKACPAINKVEKKKPTDCHSAYSTSEKIRNSSASGGVAQSVYRYCLDNNLLFTGVYFDNDRLEAVHKLGSTEDDIREFTNSKYTFSYMGDISEKITECLKADKKIVFIGLPCQVAAVKKYVENVKVDEKNLTTIDIICHGVPSDNYIKEHVKDICKGKKVENLSFRDERFMTSKFVFSVDYGGKNYHKYVESNDNFQIGYHNATIYRPNCYNCIYADSQRCGDITIGDFTGLGRAASIKENVAKMKYKGVSCVLCNSTKGENLLNELITKNYLITEARPMDEALEYENQLMKPSVPSPYRAEFVDLYSKVGFTKACNSAFKKEKLKRPIIHAAKMCVKRILGRK